MSNSGAPPQGALRAEAADAQAAAWLERREFGPADQGELDAWLAQSWQHRAAYWRMRAVWDETNRFAALRRPMKESQRTGRYRTSWPFIARAVAAFALIAVLGGGGIWLLGSPETRIFSTELGARKTLTLSDGSQIELNTDTTIRIARDQRQVRLDKGEAYFEIKHDAEHPFTVTVGDHRVTDLGTKFVVRHDHDHTRVALVEGLAELQSDGAGKRGNPIVLMPGDVAVAHAGVLSVVRKSDRELADQLGWRRGLLIFYHTTLADAANEFNRYNQKKLVIADEDAAHRRINGTFLANNVEVFGHVAQVVLGLHIQTHEHEVIISR